MYAWEQLRDLVRNNFQGNYVEPKDAGHLFAVKQAPDETLRSFFRRFAEVKCQVKGVNETTVINAATCGLQKGPLSERLACKPISTVAELFDKMEEYARAEEDSNRRAEGASTAAPRKTSGEKTSGQQDQAAQTASKPRGNYRQKGRGVYHVDAAQNQEGSKRGGRGGRNRGRGRGRHGGRQPDARDGAERITSYCDLHGECPHTTADCRTIAAMNDYVNRR